MITIKEKWFEGKIPAYTLNTLFLHKEENTKQEKPQVNA